MSNNNGERTFLSPLEWARIREREAQNQPSPYTPYGTGGRTWMGYGVDQTLPKRRRAVHDKKKGSNNPEILQKTDKGPDANGPGGPGSADDAGPRGAPTPAPNPALEPSPKPSPKPEPEGQTTGIDSFGSDYTASNTNRVARRAYDPKDLEAWIAATAAAQTPAAPCPTFNDPMMQEPSADPPPAVKDSMMQEFSPERALELIYLIDQKPSASSPPSFNYPKMQEPSAGPSPALNSPLMEGLSTSSPPELNHPMKQTLSAGPPLAFNDPTMQGNLAGPPPGFNHPVMQGTSSEPPSAFDNRLMQGTSAGPHPASNDSMVHGPSAGPPPEFNHPVVEGALAEPSPAFNYYVMEGPPSGDHTSDVYYGPPIVLSRRSTCEQILKNIREAKEADARADREQGTARKKRKTGKGRASTAMNGQGC
ncbi:hypothetical protein B0T10DRAFT_561314 [Thelonectria olida]|uniref:Uncharacterized protein n=1 Tax=Thelonectria olida TaxID=1576542 RepID=A0A9P9ASN9_9HYPO|nr:hypothetical protein B0T10DRAFT_561314 [Thelonectria olida]